MDAGLPAQLPARQPANSRRSFLAPVWAEARMQGYYCILQIRNDMLIQWLTALVEMLVARQLWIALYNGRLIYNGYTLDQTLTYVVLSMVIANQQKDDGVQYMHSMIRSGDILFAFIYPLHFTIGLIVSSLSSLVISLLTTAAPLLLMAVFVLKVPLPDSPLLWLMFIISFFLGYLILNWIDILAGLLGFWTTETSGLVAWKRIIVAILSGAYLPLWIFPPAIERLIAYLPFRGIQYVPLSILVGWIGPESYLRELVVQIGWVVVLALIAEVLYRLALRKVSIQGG